MGLENGLEAVMRIPQVLICLGHYNKNAIVWVAYRQPKFISHSSRGWKSKIKVPADLVYGEN